MRHIVAILTVSVLAKRHSGRINENHVIAAIFQCLTDFLSDNNTFSIVFCKAYNCNDFIFKIRFLVTQLLDLSVKISFLNITAPLSFFLIVSAIPLKINRSGGFLINRELLVSLHREMHLMNLSVAADVAVFAQKRQNAAVTCGEIHFRMTDILNPFA